MSREVKEWKPNTECEQCKQAVCLFDSHQRIAEHSNAMARKQIRIIWDERVALEKALSERTAINIELRDALKLCVKELQHRHTARVITSDEAEALRVGKEVLAKLESGGGGVS